MNDLEHLQTEESTWWDVGIKRNVHGTVYRYRFTDEHVGVWEVEVRLMEEPLKATVSVLNPNHSGDVYDQLSRKNLVFQPCPGNSKLFYHPLGIAYVDEGRVKRKRINSFTAVPDSIRSRYRLTVYREICPETRNRGLVDKIVALVPVDRPEEMALLAIYELVWPLFVP